jgi:hypothetical protein
VVVELSGKGEEEGDTDKVHHPTYLGDRVLIRLLASKSILYIINNWSGGLSLHRRE